MIKYSKINGINYLRIHGVSSSRNRSVRNFQILPIADATKRGKYYCQGHKVKR